MAFIDKKDPVVLNIKITSKGRELLSKGSLGFKYYAVGDSEIDYTLQNINLSNILRPADKNPSILSFIPKNLGGDVYNLITSVSSTPTIIQNIVEPLGFFTTINNITSFNIDGDHVKQPDIMIYVPGVQSGKILNLLKAPTYLGNVNEPAVGDYLLIKWVNGQTNINSTGYTINDSNPTPYLIYKIDEIVSGKLITNDLIIEVDRNLPDFTDCPENAWAGAVVYYNYINYSGTSTIYDDYSTEYVDDALLAFKQNCQCPTITFPFWNLSIVYTEDIIGVDPVIQKKFNQYNSSSFAGFISYIQNQAPIIKKMGIIHYTNSSPSNTYAEELYQNTPILTLPTIMWHKSPTAKMGLTLIADGSSKLLTGSTKSLNTNYYDLVDTLGNIVGKIFNDLKLFVIEDQELLFAMSYKSNRSWTLPNYKFGVNDNVSIGCTACYLSSVIVNFISPSSYNANDGKLTISNIVNTGDVIVEVFANSIEGRPIIFSQHYYTNDADYFYEEFSPETIITIPNLTAGDYFISINDFGSPSCRYTGITTISLPNSTLQIINSGTTYSHLNSKFEILQGNPTSITVYNNQNNIGTTYGSPYLGVSKFETPNTITWYTPLSGAWSLSNPFSFLSSYIITLADVTGTTLPSIAPEAIVAKVSKPFVAVGNPLNSNFGTGQGSDVNGKYVLISNYLASINLGLNPIVGKIQFSVYPTNLLRPTKWEELPVGSVAGITMKIYTNSIVIGSYTVQVREFYNNIEIFKVLKTITII